MRLLLLFFVDSLLACVIILCVQAADEMVPDEAEVGYRASKHLSIARTRLNVVTICNASKKKRVEAMPVRRSDVRKNASVLFEMSIETKRNGRPCLHRSSSNEQHDARTLCSRRRRRSAWRCRVASPTACALVLCAGD